MSEQKSQIFWGHSRSIPGLITGSGVGHAISPKLPEIQKIRRSHKRDCETIHGNMIPESISYASMEFAFWVSVAGVFYAYFGYPLVLWLLAIARRPDRTALPGTTEYSPSLSLVIPAHNEGDVIRRKIENSLSLKVPGEYQVVVISDGSTDDTASIAGSFADEYCITFIDIPERKGKANALNIGVQNATGEIVVFSDASIILDRNALIEVAKPFDDPNIGCVSGEDKIDGGGGEGLYGKYELLLRRLESASGSIVGASGSFYAQRRGLVTEFPEGVAPDFLSVLKTIEQGYRAVTCPLAIGYMTSVVETREEFRRKVRTVIRGMTALFNNKRLLNPFRFPLTSFFLLSHKLMRWLVPFLLIVAFVTNLFLIGYSVYPLFLSIQCVPYLLSGMGFVAPALASRYMIVRIPLFFSISNAAILIAWVQYLLGVRQEIWGPSKRAT